MTEIVHDERVSETPQNQNSTGIWALHQGSIHFKLVVPKRQPNWSRIYTVNHIDRYKYRYSMISMSHIISSSDMSVFLTAPEKS